jgi:hypothetical protein
MDTIDTGTAENFPPVIAGNVTDDDAAYVDDLVQEDPAPPTFAELPLEARHESSLPNVPLNAPDKIMARYGNYTGPQDPMLVLPPDPFRKHLIITGDIATNLFFAGTKQDLDSSAYNFAYRVFPGSWALPVAIPNYTGALWVLVDRGVGAATAWQFSVLAVTA